MSYLLVALVSLVAGAALGSSWHSFLVGNRLGGIDRKLDRLLRMEESLMATAEDLDKALTELEADVEKEDSDIVALREKLAEAEGALANQPPATDLQPFLDRVNALKSKIEAIENPAPAPAPAAGTSEDEPPAGS